MSNNQIAANGLRVSIEMGSDYEASNRVGDALEELAQALAEEDGQAEVEGFGMKILPEMGFAMDYETIKWVKPGQQPSAGYLKIDGVDGNRSAYIKFDG